MDNSNNMSRMPIYPLEHNHIMVYVGTQRDRCEQFDIYECGDKNCGHWEERDYSHNTSNCDLQVTRFSTRTTCYECSKCNRKEIETS